MCWQKLNILVKVSLKAKIIFVSATVLGLSKRDRFLSHLRFNGLHISELEDRVKITILTL